MTKRTLDLDKLMRVYDGIPLNSVPKTKLKIEMKQYKQVKFRLSSWKKLRRSFFGRLNETFSDYIERIARRLKLLNEN